MPLRLVSFSSTSFIATRRILAGAALVALGYIVALIASPSAEPPFGVSVGSAAGVKGVGDAGRFASSATAANESPRAFDYFPDRYQNQAKEAAEPIDTF